MNSALLSGAARVSLAVIVNSLWQGALIAFVAWVAVRIFSRANAATRYAIWSLALLAMIVVPVLTSLSRVSVESPAPPHVKLIVAAPSSQEAPAVPAVPQQSAAQSRSALSGLQGFSVPQLRFTTPLAVTIFAIWALAAIVVLGRLMVAIVWLERLKRDSLPLDVAYRDQMPQWNAALKDFRDVRLCVSGAIEVPVAIGLFDAMILLPKHLVQSLEPEEIDQIALHELGHLRRNDDWTNALQRVACSLLFFNPAAWLVSRQLDIEREVACDDYVLQATGAARSYAFCLTRIAEVTSWPHRTVAAPGVFITRRNISIRIERLLRTGRAIGSAISPAIAASVIVALVVVSALVRTMTPSVAYTLPATDSGDHAAKKAVIKMRTQPAPDKHHTETHVAKNAAIGVKVGTAVGTSVGSAVADAVTNAVTMTHTQLEEALQQAEHARQQAEHQHQIAQATKMNKTATAEGICKNCDFKDADLRGHDFSGQTFNGADFERAKLRGARFDGTQLTGADFAHADLRDASFSGANLIGCDLRGAQLGGARFDGAHLVGCDFGAQTLTPGQARAFLTSCAGCNFSGADLHGMNLRNIRLQATNLEGANLSDADLSGAQLSAVNLDGANLSGAKLNGARFDVCNLQGADLSKVDLSVATFIDSSVNGRTR
jgi:uncharacterized protein YjbI with pentapeptide repeats/beta-lactamase regulating signal transducer with metallopeptidase domain